MIIIVGAVKKILPVSSDGAVVENAKPPATDCLAGGCAHKLARKWIKCRMCEVQFHCICVKTTTPILFAYNWGEPERSPTLLSSMHSNGIYN